MIVLFATAHAAVCSWSTPLWNDGAISFRHPDAARDLVTIDVGRAYFDEAGVLQPGNVLAPAVKLTLETDGKLWVAARDESIHALGVVAMPVAALHPAKSLAFGPLVRVSPQHIVVLRAGAGHRVRVEPQLPPWYRPKDGLSRSVPCRDVDLSIRAEAAVPRPAMDADGGLLPNTEIPLSAAPGGPALGTIRCENVGEKSDSTSWAEYDEQTKFQCPWVSVLSTSGDAVKISIESNEALIEGWMPSAMVGVSATGYGYGTGGMGARLKKYRCQEEKLYVLDEGKAFAVATLASGTLIKQLLVLEGGWSQVRVPESVWLAPVQGELVLDPEAFARCTLLEG